jgi:hypothetical protein
VVSRIENHDSEIPEKDLQALIVRIAKTAGWMVYHTYDSRKSAAGFPDLVLIHTAKKKLFVMELKSKKGAVTDEQAKWIDAFTLVFENGHYDAKIIRPSDLDYVIKKLTN